MGLIIRSYKNPTREHDRDASTVHEEARSSKWRFSFEHMALNDYISSKRLFPNLWIYSGVSTFRRSTMFTALFALARTVGGLQWNEFRDLIRKSVAASAIPGPSAPVGAGRFKR